MIYRTCPLVVLLALAAFTTCLADTVVLDNGSRLVGKVVAVKQGAVSLQTDFAGTLTLPAKRIASLQADEALRFRLPNDKETEGKLTVQNGQAEIRADGTPVVLPIDQIALAGPAGKPLPEDAPPPPKRLWSYEVNASFRGKSGNTDSKELGFGAQAKRKGENSDLRLYVNWNRDEKNDTITEDELVGGVDFERELSDRFAWYTRAELETDDIEQISLRATAAGGLGYYLINNKTRQFRVRAGLQYERESYDYDRQDEDAIGMEFGLRHAWRISDWGKLVNDVTYSAAFNEWTDYRVVHESSLDVPLAKSELWKLRLGLSHEYNSISAPGTEDLDTTYFLKLVFNWK